MRAPHDDPLAILLHGTPVVPSERDTDSVLTQSPQRYKPVGCRRRVLGAVGLLAALLACPACSHPTCDEPAHLPPSVFVRADALLEENPGTRIEVCASDCITFSSNDDQGELGPQLVIADGDDHTPISLRATVTTPRQPPLVSTLTTELTRATTVGSCGSHISYEAYVHLTSTGKLRQGPS